MINKNSKIFLAGHKGMIGSAILRKLKSDKYNKIYYRNKNQLNLLNQEKVYNYLRRIKPDAVIIAAARVGGIVANNTYRAILFLKIYQYKIMLFTEVIKLA